MFSNPGAPRLSPPQMLLRKVQNPFATSVSFREVGSKANTRYHGVLPGIVGVQSIGGCVLFTQVTHIVVDTGDRIAGSDCVSCQLAQGDGWRRGVSTYVSLTTLPGWPAE